MSITEKDHDMDGLREINDCWSDLMAAFSDSSSAGQDFDVDMLLDDGSGGNMPPNTRASSTGTEPKIEPKLTEEALKKASELVFKNASECHSRWDRTRRGFCGVLKRSEKSAATSGCRFETDLQQLVDDVDTLDNKVLQKESDYKAGTEFTNLGVADMEEVKKVVVRMTALVKEGSRKSQALEMMMKVETSLSQKKE